MLMSSKSSFPLCGRFQPLHSDLFQLLEDLMEACTLVDTILQAKHSQISKKSFSKLEISLFAKTTKGAVGALEALVNFQ